MEIEEVELLFNKYYGNYHEFIDFSKVENKYSSRADLHAMIMLDKLFPSKKNMIARGEHDEVWLDIDGEEFAKIATEELILELVRCGVMFDEESLFIFA